MRLLFVHERFGAMAGAEVNLLLTATELKNRGHTVGILYGQPTGKGEAAWRGVFSGCFLCSDGQTSDTARAALQEFRPEAIYVHKMADLTVIGELVESGLPLVRMVHDHDLYCMR